MSYRLINASRLDDETAAALVQFAWERIPGGIRGSTAIRLKDNTYPNGQAGPGADRKWAGRAKHCCFASVPPDDCPELGQPRVCWHATAAKRHARHLHAEILSQNGGRREDWMWERAISDTYDWIAAEYAAGKTHIGQWPIYVTHTAEEAVLHTLAHELYHVLQRDRDRGKQSELLCEEGALLILTAYQAETEEVAA